MSFPLDPSRDRFDDPPAFAAPDERPADSVAPADADHPAAPRIVIQLGRRGIRLRSPTVLCGWPLYDIATGPDLERGERFGHARGWIAFGDVAYGLIACGGFARGFLAMGGVALGVIGCGGVSLGMLLAMGGLAFGSIAIGGLAIGAIAAGGAAVGYVAIGGAAFGHYALGASAFGEHVINAWRQDPEAIKFFGQFVPDLKR